MFHILPVSSEVFVRQTAYVYELKVLWLKKKCTEVCIQIHIVLRPIIENSF